MRLTEDIKGEQVDNLEAGKYFVTQSRMGGVIIKKPDNPKILAEWPSEFFGQLVREEKLIEAQFENLTSLP